jgi:para-aminobenzoate synthetase component 1
VLDERLEEYKVAEIAEMSLPVSGACIATFDYELGYELEPVHGERLHPIDEPTVQLSFFNSLIVHDYRTGQSFITGHGPARSFDKRKHAFEKLVKDYYVEQETISADRESVAAATRVVSNFSAAEYEEAVRLIKEYIAAGDIYQANLTQQFTAFLADDVTPQEIFFSLRGGHPASFAAFIRRGDDTVISASPERFLRVSSNKEGRIVEAWPIKGTRPRGMTDEDDRRLRDELFNSEKDRAENVMIVDLLRNDLGRICKFGSVEVPELFTVQEHPTLFHLVSKVRGKLREDVRPSDLLRAAFPCGSITGAPKIRAMEVINEIEETERGISMGAIGYFSFDGQIDLNVAIRTMSVRGGVARFNTGGGIVADSDPSAEYEESMTKAKALLRAVGARRQGEGDHP